MYSVLATTENFTQNTTLRPETYGGWSAINTGMNEVQVNGYSLQPGEGLDFTHLQPDVIWGSPITIQGMLPDGTSCVRVTRLTYKKMDEKSIKSLTPEIKRA